MDSNQSYIFIYGRSGCPYTKKAIQLCQQRQEPHLVQYVYTEEQSEYLKSQFNHGTFPMCFAHDGSFLGGSDVLEEYLQGG